MFPEFALPYPLVTATHAPPAVRAAHAIVNPLLAAAGPHRPYREIHIRVLPRSVQKCTATGRLQARGAYEVVQRGAPRSLQGCRSAAASSAARGDGLDEALARLADQLALARRTARKVPIRCWRISMY